MSDSSTGQHEFKAEIRQLLDIVVHSLYTDREIFLRELVSNASDAMEKLRHLQATAGHEIADPDLPLEIHITTDDTAKTITIADHGVGMTRDELGQHLGTIAHSGTKAFLQAMREGTAKPSNLIGQFGVGFYSAFMVAKRVRVFTRGWHSGDEHLVWTSEGLGGYSIDEAPGQQRGCRIVLDLQDEQAEYAREERVRELIRTYSNFVGFPILLNGKRVNEVEALWLKQKNEVTDDQYDAFYKFTAHAFDTPSYRLHFTADAPLDIHALVFVPGENPERWGLGQVDPGVALYCRRVLIDASPPGLLPDWLRFLKGVIDSDDLPLNISRETMQDSALVRKLGDIITKRVLKMLEKEAGDDPEKFAGFHRHFARFLKEGIASDYAHREPLARLLRFESTLTDPGQSVGFADYLRRAKEGQDKIYYLVGASRAQLEASPYLEAFKARGLEVILFTDAVDDYVIESLGTFEGKQFVAANRSGLDLGEDLPAEGEALAPDQTDKLCGFLKDTLGDQVGRVEGGKRLVASPAVALVPADAMSPQMRRMMRAMREDFNEPLKIDLEINPRHPLVRRLAQARQTNPELAALVARQLLDNALMAAGLLEDARDTVGRMNTLMEKVLGQA